MNTRRLALLFLLIVLVPAAAAQDASTYVVRTGDTLFRIATMHEISVDELRRMNGLTDNVIHPGQELVVRPAAGAPEVDPWPAPVVVPEPADDVEREPAAGVDTGPARAADPEATWEFDPEPERYVDPDRPLDAPHPLDDREPQLPGPDGPELEDPLIAPLPEGELPPGELEQDDDFLAGAEVVTYEVEEGETLYGIAAKFGTKAYVLFTLNAGMVEPLQPGRTLSVPARAAPVVHRVRPGDTLSALARRYGVTVDAIRRANGLTGDVISVGRDLAIPGAYAAGQGPQLPEVYAAGEVLVYPETYVGRAMASGEPYDPTEFVISHPELPFDTVLLVENSATGAATFARIADRGPLDDRALMDVSEAVADFLGLEDGAVVRVRLVE